LLRDFNIEEIRQEILICSPRRWGKTTSVSMFAASAMVAIEGVTIAIFSTGRRASRALMELVYAFLMRLPGMRERVVTYNQETLRIQFGNGDVRTLNSYPSSVEKESTPFVLALYSFACLCWRTRQRGEPTYSRCGSTGLPSFFVLFLGSSRTFDRRKSARRRLPTSTPTTTSILLQVLG